MAKILLAYYSQSGHTKKMAEFIFEGMKKESVDVVLKNVEDIKVDELLDYQGIVFGSPVYYGSMAAAIKKLFDDSVKFHTKLDGRVGGAFASSANIGGGNETTILDILNAMLIHGMIIQGDPKGDHYGPVSIGMPDERSQKQCLRYGERIARLVKKVFP
ncbi:MAG: flavodoxin [Omnitrophica WOR_2 bacterium GWF2_43_52]|nr:MAG: flavodoxin [Omnitrophica WOR_2 bacterium GWC2_44_8]OGX20800.1 MAG: flavodoxin [Omnitrophica WOR_2 bacterium GWF2_43_52]HAH19830.1 flavodoxin [Candidatus Omnitrophota bacterium]HBG63454.1 flavodoxin [Candidatus Omnitrophota bacterium]